MKRLLPLLLLLLLAGCATAQGPATITAEAASTDPANPRWTALSAGDGQAISLQGVYICQAHGTWAGTTLTMQTYRQTDGAWVSVSGPAALVGATADTQWVELKARNALYRPRVAGAGPVNVACGRVSD